MGNSTAAAAYHRRALAEGLKTGASKAELSNIYLWLARWELQREKEKGEEGDFEKAEEYLKEVMQVQEDKEVCSACEFGRGGADLLGGCRRRRCCASRWRCC